MAEREVYLGDGCYAMFDGFQIRLRAPREECDHVIYLEPEIYRALQEFAARCWPSMVEETCLPVTNKGIDK